jgi:hypothetical protein
MEPQKHVTDEGIYNFILLKGKMSDRNISVCSEYLLQYIQNYFSPSCKAIIPTTLPNIKICVTRMMQQN